ncbi:MAG TPA: 16S rRNA (cytosine(1402)-N(4))-methyltransferase RsmH [Candidatus Paceibacterota bacterium]|nr:16S rRNA (cytosine(1402)-N(4))-methyltransferase RsmH [Candidatus Paceibacterota bacterium]
MHVPVLLQEVLKYLAPQPNENFIDGTLGTGGYTKAILEMIAPKGKVLGVDLDKDAYQRTQETLSHDNVAEDRLLFRQGNFSQLKSITEEISFTNINGIVLDLGLNTDSLENSGRGFSFKKDEPLIMTFTTDWQNAPRTAAQIVNSYSEKELAEIIWQYGEEKYSRLIARAIVAARQKNPITTTGMLVSLIEQSVPKGYERGRINPATRTFQALRIATNDELNNLNTALEEIPNLLTPGGRYVVVSFHSLEDRLVKRAFRKLKDNGQAKILTPKPVVADATEINLNPKSHSAKLRAIQMI